MSDFVIVIGASPDAVAATARELGVRINVNEIKSFDSLATSYSDDFPDSGNIETEQNGFVVVGEAI